MIEKGTYNGYGYVPSASASDEIAAEIDKYSRDPKDNWKSYRMSAKLYAQNDYKDMGELNDLVKKENARRAQVEASRKEAAAKRAAYEAEAKAKDDALRAGAAKLASEFDKMFK